MFENSVILITGGTGSFGQTIMQRLLKTTAREIRIFSRDEKKQEDMRIAMANTRLKFYIGDVRDKSSIEEAMFGVDYVFHAAALKQVPSCEFYPMEAFRTNVIGTDNVLLAAISNDVKRLVLLSTDKAVYPINAMGISKAMAEKVLIAKSRLYADRQTVMCSTRYGNVMASRGSVIPLFIDQICKDEPITITDPHMTRFMMSLEDSVDLVLHAFQNGEPGDIFVQKAPAATILSVAEALKDIFASSVPIKIIGTRHGEKLYETLVSREEMAKSNDMGRYYRIICDDRDLNYSKYFVEGEISIATYEDYTSHSTTRLTRDEVRSLLRGLDIVGEKLDA